MPWRSIFRSLSEAYGWTPLQIAEMTLAQIFVYYWQAYSPGESPDLDPTKAQKLCMRIKGKRDWWMSRAKAILGLE